MDAVFKPGTPANASPPITGRFLAHNKLSTAERAFLGVDFLSGKKQPVRFTDKQIAGLVGVSIPTLTAAKHVVIDQPQLRPEIEAGRMSLSAVNNNRKPSNTFFDRLVAKYPKEYVAALDRFTAPELPLVAAE